MSKIQTIFDKVLDAGIYPKIANTDDCSSNYMCNALRLSKTLKIITHEEYELARTAIEDYLGGYISLWSFLYSRNLPNEQKDCISIYRNWANRPQIRVTP